MPISHRLKLIFIHISKTGGSSIEKMLNLFPDSFHAFNPEMMIGIDRDGYVLQALPLYNYGKYYSKEIIDTYFKFTVVRNPYDRCISDYSENNRGYECFETYLRFVKHTLETHSTDQLLKYNRKYYTHHWLPQVTLIGDVSNFDMVLKFENLSDDIKTLSTKIGTELMLPHIGASKRNHDYHVYYTDTTRALVNDIYHDDFVQFGYSFE